MVIPNTATIALTLDKPSYRARETVAVSAAIVNTGKFDLNDMAVTITIPDAGYSETISTGILAGQKATVPFSFTIPNTITPGFHTVSAVAVLPSGMSVTQTEDSASRNPRWLLPFPAPAWSRAVLPCNLWLRITVARYELYQKDLHSGYDGTLRTKETWRA